MCKIMMPEDRQNHILKIKDQHTAFYAELLGDEKYYDLIGDLKTYEDHVVIWTTIPGIKQEVDPYRFLADTAPDWIKDMAIKRNWYYVRAAGKN